LAFKNWKIIYFFKKEMNELIMGKIKIEKNIFIPMPMSILGVKVSGKENYMAVGWITRANANPPMIAMGIGRSHYTVKGIVENKEFSVNFPGENLLIATDYIGICSGANTDKSQIFTPIFGELKKAPMIQESPLSISCKLVNIIELPTNSIIIGEIAEVFCDKEFYDGKTIKYKEMKAFFLTMPDNKYWSFGNEIGKAWSDGKKYQPQK
jgi:flavin reductase (DIM6/NTAB) family NADH-FMN oxidoreductase RutF